MKKKKNSKKFSNKLIKTTKRTNKKSISLNQLLSIVFRYFFLIIIGFFGLNVFYNLFSPITINLSYKFLSLFFEVIKQGNVLLINNHSIEIINACIAGGAYFLFLILSFSIAKINFIKRIFLVLFSWFCFFILNLARIILLSFLFINNNSLFDVSHNFFWFVGSTFFVILIWFFSVKIFKINEIPFYDDLLFLFNNSSFKNLKIK
jgi:exosortase/archaeosortase family protein